jgi:hypothetical protein
VQSESGRNEGYKWLKNGKRQLRWENMAHDPFTVKGREKSQAAEVG